MHIWQPVSDPLVAINTGRFAFGQRGRMHGCGALALAGKVHEFEVVTVTAFA
ncbi:hypothetical protein D3C76_1471250 [compost metagenome]